MTGHMIWFPGGMSLNPPSTGFQTLIIKYVVYVLLKVPALLTTYHMSTYKVALFRTIFWYWNVSRSRRQCLQYVNGIYSMTVNGWALVKCVYQCTFVHRTVFDSDLDSCKSKFFNKIGSKLGNYFEQFWKINTNSGLAVH